MTEEALPAGFGELTRVQGMPELPPYEPQPVPAARVEQPQVGQMNMKPAGYSELPQKQAPSADFLIGLQVARGVLEAAGAILAPKALLLIAMLGALALTVPALIFADWGHLLAAVSFDVLVFWPIAFLYMKG